MAELVTLDAPDATPGDPFIDLPTNALHVYDACMQVMHGTKVGPVDVVAVSNACGLRRPAVLRHLKALAAAGMAYWWAPRLIYPRPANGENAPKLDARLAAEIRAAFEAMGRRYGAQVELAAHYGVSRQAISNVLCGVTYPEAEPATAEPEAVPDDILDIIRGASTREAEESEEGGDSTP
jgi:hypothetical protein